MKICALSRSVLWIMGAMVLTGCAELGTTQIASVSDGSLVLRDQSRNREVPVHISKPKSEERCTRRVPCPITFISGGYGESPLNYSFIASALAARGFLVVSVQHDLSSDEPLPREGNLYDLRSPFWARGMENMIFVRESFKARYPQFDWDRPIFLGHSNGGDISVWFGREHPFAVRAIITLDHRRVPMLRSSQPKQLSLRGIDYPADEGVLPSLDEQREFEVEVSTIPGAKHNDMVDAGPQEVRHEIIGRTIEFLVKLGIPGMLGTGDTR